MIPLENVKPYVPYLTSLVFVILFVYAASNKLMDYQQFKEQLGQSSILSEYADVVAWMIPLAEIVISFLLLLNRYRLFALFACLGLMTMFTAYILLMLHFSDTLPCSCGGVISELGWIGHLYFNGSLMVLAAVGIFTSLKHQKNLSIKNTT